MTEEKHDLPAEEFSEEEEQKQKGILVLFRFILVPLVVVGIVVFVIVFFGRMALKEKSVNDFLYDIRTGSQSERWQAAYQLSTLLANPNQDYIEQARKQLPEIILIFRQEKGKDPKIRQYLVLTMGRLKDARAVPVLQESLSDDDPQTVFWSIWALGSIGDRSSTPFIIETLESTDSGVRVMSAYVLGALEDPAAMPALQGHLDDNSPEVAWNAAIALARMKDSSGRELLKQMLSRNYLAGFPNLSEEKKEELMINTIRVAVRISDPEMLTLIRDLSTSDPNPRVRDTALSVLN